MAKIKNMHYTICLKVISSSAQVALPPAFARLEQRGGGGASKKAHICKVCGKEGRGSVIKEHIEANHLDGMAIPCNLCGKTSRSRHALKTHKHNYHK